MAITRQAKNYSVIANKKYEAIVNGKYDKYADKITIDAVDGDLSLISNKKVISNGGS
ncbi:hypothetical protein [Psychroserpens sp. NJDZ02]|uniref:hypothetical protein n=1 Tax=Psychroserpens sp. NJDZ02 TaxID=2570561 RepID=UPI0014562A74|nr:hypothetical protein [Psychroserpens sp. NJDZ02]